MVSSLGPVFSNAVEGLRLPCIQALITDNDRKWAANQRERRSRILATARQLLCEYDADEISMKMIAARCDVAVQTIYNLLGGKLEVFNQAICEELNRIPQYIESGTPYASRVSALSDLAVLYVMRSPIYIRNVMKLWSPLDGGLHQSLEDCIVDNFSKILAGTQVVGVNRRPFDVRKFSASLNSVIIGTIMEWAGGHYRLEQLRSEMAARAEQFSFALVDGYS
jgi:AcrR family transcriptional regulator